MLCIFQNWFDDYDIFFSFFLEGEGREGRISSREALINAIRNIYALRLTSLNKNSNVNVRDVKKKKKKRKKKKKKKKRWYVYDKK